MEETVQAVTQAATHSAFDWTTLLVSTASLIAAIIAAKVAIGARKDAERIAESAHDEWAQQKWFDLFFLTKSAYDAMDRFLADSNFQGNRLIGIRGGEDFPTRRNDVIRMFREVLMMASVFPECPIIQTLLAAVSVKFEDDPFEMYSRSKERLKNLWDVIMDIRDNAAVDSSVLKRLGQSRNNKA